MLNRVYLMGRIVNDIELKETSTGKSYVNFTLACNRSFGKDNKNACDYIDCVAWNNTAEFIFKWFPKGVLTICSGKLNASTWKDSSGNSRKKTQVVVDEIYFGEDKRKLGTTGRPTGDAEYVDLDDFSDGDIPF